MNSAVLLDSVPAIGWPRVRLDDVADISSGLTLGRNIRGVARNVPYLRVANVKAGHLDLCDVKTTPATQVEIDDNLLAPGDLLLTEGGDPDKLGRGTLWRGELPVCLHQNHIFRVRFNRSLVEPEFAAAQAGSSYGKAYFFAHAKQTTGIASINKTVLSAFPFLLPDLSTQRRIVNKLRDQFEAFERAQLALKEQLSAAESLPSALIRESLAGGAQSIRLGEVLAEITRGIGPGWRERPLLGATRTGLAPAKEPIGKVPERYKPVEPGAIFYNPMRVLLGSIAYVESVAGIVSPDYVAFTTATGRLHPRWFYHWLRSEAGEYFIKGLARGAVRERILFSRLAEGVVSVPPWERQVAAVGMMEGLPTLMTGLYQQLESLALYPPALLRDAFVSRT